MVASVQINNPTFKISFAQSFFFFFFQAKGSAFFFPIPEKTCLLSPARREPLPQVEVFKYLHPCSEMTELESGKDRHRVAAEGQTFRWPGTPIWCLTATEFPFS